jgi:hypothetical protein
VDGGHGIGVRLQLLQPAEVDEGDARHAVGNTALVERLEARDLRLRGRDDHLAARLHGDAVLVAEGLHQPHALDAEARLVGAGLVVDAGVNDPAVVAGLVLGDLPLFLEHHQPHAG